MYADAGGVTVSYFEWVKNLSHIRFGRMERRAEEARHVLLVEELERLSVERGTPVTISAGFKAEYLRGAGELELVRSGLDDTMRTAYQSMREIWHSRKDVEDLYVLREQLEGLAVRLAAERQATARPLSRARLTEERRRWRGLVREQSLPAFGEANRAFHQMLIEASGNRHLPDMLDRTLMTLFASQFRAWVAPPDTVRAAQQHLEILDAVESGDGGAAERAMRAHVRDSAAMILRLDDGVFD
jgi:hypothetical protein